MARFFLFFFLLLVAAAPARADAAADIRAKYTPLIIAAMNGDFTTLGQGLPNNLTVVFADQHKLEGVANLANHLTQLRNATNGEVTFTLNQLALHSVTGSATGVQLVNGTLWLQRTHIGGSVYSYPIHFNVALDNGVISVLNLQNIYLQSQTDEHDQTTVKLITLEVGIFLLGVLIGAAFILILNAVKSSRLKA